MSKHIFLLLLSAGFNINELCYSSQSPSISQTCDKPQTHVPATQMLQRSHQWLFGISGIQHQSLDDLISQSSPVGPPRFACQQRTGGESGGGQTEHFALTKPRDLELNQTKTKRDKSGGKRGGGTGRQSVKRVGASEDSSGNDEGGGRDEDGKAGGGR